MEIPLSLNVCSASGLLCPVPVWWKKMRSYQKRKASRGNFGLMAQCVHVVSMVTKQRGNNVQSDSCLCLVALITGTLPAAGLYECFCVACGLPRCLESGVVLVFPLVLWCRWFSGWHMPSARPHWNAWWTACNSASARILWCSSSLKERHKKLQWFKLQLNWISVNGEQTSEMVTAWDSPHGWWDSLFLTSSLGFTKDQRLAWVEPQTTPKPNKDSYCRDELGNKRKTPQWVSSWTTCSEKRCPSSLCRGSIRHTPGSVAWSAAPWQLSGFPATWLGSTSFFVYVLSEVQTQNDKVLQLRSWHGSIAIAYFQPAWSNNSVVKGQWSHREKH